jgi:serine/threonine protein phosphatase PrpC
MTHRVVVPGDSHDNRFRYKPRAEDVADVWWSGNTPILGVADGLGGYAKAADAASLALCIAKHQTSLFDFGRPGSTEVDHDKASRLFGAIQSEYLDTIRYFEDQDQWKTTLALVVLLSRRRLWLMSVGDSILAVRQDEIVGATSKARLHLVERPLRTGDNQTGTATLHSTFDDMVIRIVDLENVAGVWLSTDGLEDFIVRPTELHPVQFDAGFHDLLDRLRQDRRFDVDRGLWRDNVRLKKGDDIGVALAAWV